MAGLRARSSGALALRRLGILALLGIGCLNTAAGRELAPALARTAPDADPAVISLAVQALDCSLKGRTERPRRLALIDYSRPSTEIRLWVFDLRKKTLEFAERVAHGRNSGEVRSTLFSNDPGSYRSSLGLFRTSETYEGRHGLALRLDGLEPGFNDRARERAIVIHGAPYVSDGAVHSLGRLGRSLGCPAVPEAVARPLIDELKEGQYVFAYYPDPAWLKGSRLLTCPGARQSAGYTAAAASRGRLPGPT